MPRALPLREAAEGLFDCHTGRANPWGSPETRPDILQARAMLSGSAYARLRRIAQSLSKLHLKCLSPPPPSHVHTQVN